jgi:hypothetical protein
MSVGFAIAWIAVVLLFAVIYRDLFRTPAYIPLFALNSVPVAIGYLCMLDTKELPLLAFLWTYLAFLVGIALFFYAVHALARGGDAA